MNRESITRPSACLMIWLLALPSATPPAELKIEAARGFEEYTQLAGQRIQSDLQPGGRFLWVDSLPETRRPEAMARLRSGQVVIGRMETPPTAASISTPGAMIHDWVGTVLIQGATLPRVLATVQDYDRHREYYSPEVVRSRIIEHSGNDFTIYLRLKRTKIITVVFDTEHQVRYHSLDATHAYSESRSTHITELEDAGETRERALPAGEEHGFLWRLNSYWRFSETREGVFVQCEAISLTRDIPTGLGWLVGGFVESIPKESISFTLESTRAAVYRAAK